jgi:hypothetical protein
MTTSTQSPRSTSEQSTQTETASAIAALHNAVFDELPGQQQRKAACRVRRLLGVELALNPFDTLALVEIAEWKQIPVAQAVGLVLGQGDLVDQFNDCQAERFQVANLS